MKKAIAIFDLDKTLIPFDCDEAWGLYMHEQGLASTDFLARQRTYFEHYDAGTLDIHDYQRFSLEATIRAGRERATQELQRFVSLYVVPRLTSRAFELIESHRIRGHRLLVITATHFFVSRAVVDALGIQELLAIDLATDEHGWYNGEILGTPTFKEGKVIRLEQWMHQHQLQRPEYDLYFYSDSINDIPLLAYADHPTATNPSPALRAYALERGWPVLDLFAEPDNGLAR